MTAKGAEVHAGDEHEDNGHEFGIWGESKYPNFASWVENRPIP